MPAIQAGTRVLGESAFGDKIEFVALSGPVEGKDFMVVWVCLPDEFDKAARQGRDPEGIPWPVEAVELISDRVGA
jgi:hypothetical protein